MHDFSLRVLYIIGKACRARRGDMRDMVEYLLSLVKLHPWLTSHHVRIDQEYVFNSRLGYWALVLFRSAAFPHGIIE